MVTLQNTTIKLGNTFSNPMKEQLVEERNKHSAEPSSSFPEGVQGAGEQGLGKGGGSPHRNG